MWPVYLTIWCDNGHNWTVPRVAFNSRNNKYKVFRTWTRERAIEDMGRIPSLTALIAIPME